MTPRCPHCGTPDGPRFSGSNKPSVAIYRCVNCGELFRAAEPAAVTDAAKAYLREADERLAALIGDNATLIAALSAELSRAWTAGWMFDPENPS